MTEQIDLATLFPGRTVELDINGHRFRVLVRPMAVAHFRRFKDAVNNSLQKLTQSELGTADIFSTVITLIADDLMDVINDSVDGIDLQDPRCPVWVFPTVAKEWFDESFGDEGKVKPWVTLIDQVVERFTGTNPNLWGSLTESSPQLDGAEETSTNSA